LANGWIPFYYSDYLADTADLTLAEHGAYHLLMAHYYSTRKPLDACASVLHRICRCETDADRGHSENRKRVMDFGQTAGSASEVGRFPANLVLDEEAAMMLDQQGGNLRSGANPEQRHSDITRGIYGEFKGRDCFPARGADSGGASRFFYCAKADDSERHNGAKNAHPTVKPIDLCAWLAKLLLPPATVTPRRLLVPFSGSGSEMIGAIRAGWDEVVGIEQEHGYCDIARRRIVADAPLLNSQNGDEAHGNSTD
jgi:hypothetical protein